MSSRPFYLKARVQTRREIAAGLARVQLRPAFPRHASKVGSFGYQQRVLFTPLRKAALAFQNRGLRFTRVRLEV